MWVFFAPLILLALEVANGQQCVSDSFTNCKHTLSSEESAKIRSAGMTPTEEELAEICPSVQRNKDCLVEELEKCLPDHEDFIEFTKGSKVIFDELCDENSPLHANYVSSASCYRSLASTAEACENHAGSIYETYKEYQRQNSLEMEEMETGRYRFCFVQAYKVACLSIRMHLSCGEVAHNTFLDMVRRSKYLRQYCTQPIIEDLQTNFMDFTGLEGEQRDLMAAAFEFKRK